MTIETLVLLLIFQLKHLIADYYLQFPYMYENKGKISGWIKPLTDHCFTHGIFTMIISMIFLKNFTDLNIGEVIILSGEMMMFDISTHFITDRWKATRKTDPSQAWFWQSLGIDQMVHHIVGILIIYALTTI